MIVDKNTRVVVQGITGYQGRFHTTRMLQYGTKIVAGVTPGKGGREINGIPVFDSVEEAVNETRANASIIFVPAPFCKSSMFEAIDMDLNPVVVITEGIPILDTMKAVAYARSKKIGIVGPNTPGIIVPGKTKIGIMPNHVFKEGNIGIVARSGTLAYEIAATLSINDFGQSSCIGKGGDPITGLNFTEILQLYENDSETKAVVMIGEIGGTEEENASDFIKQMSKSVVAYIAGRTAPPGKRMGHAGAIITGKKGTAENKIKVLTLAGVKVASSPKDIPEFLKEVI